MTVDSGRRRRATCDQDAASARTGSTKVFEQQFTQSCGTIARKNNETCSTALDGYIWKFRCIP